MALLDSKAEALMIWSLVKIRKMGQKPEKNTGAWKLGRCEGLSVFRIHVLGVYAAEQKPERYGKFVSLEQIICYCLVAEHA